MGSRGSSQAGGRSTKTQAANNTEALRKLEALPGRGSSIKSILPLDTRPVKDSVLNKNFSSMPVEDVSYADLKTTQDWVGRKEVKSIIENGESDKGTTLPSAVRYKGQLYLVDGNTRTTARVLQGHKSGKMNVFNAKANPFHEF